MCRYNLNLNNTANLFI